jgi:hypothetical protein
MQDKKPQPLELLVQERKSENKEEEEEQAATELPNAHTREMEGWRIGNKCCCDPRLRSFFFSLQRLWIWKRSLSCEGI